MSLVNCFSQQNDCPGPLSEFRGHHSDPLPAGLGKAPPTQNAVGPQCRTPRGEVYGAVRQAGIAFATARRTYTKAFEHYALKLSRHMAILEVARGLGVSWDIIKDIQGYEPFRVRFSRMNPF